MLLPNHKERFRLETQTAPRTWMSSLSARTEQRKLRAFTRCTEGSVAYVTASKYFSGLKGQGVPSAAGSAGRGVAGEVRCHGLLRHVLGLLLVSLLPCNGGRAGGSKGGRISRAVACLGLLCISLHPWNSSGLQGQGVLLYVERHFTKRGPNQPILILPDTSNPTFSSCLNSGM